MLSPRQLTSLLTALTLTLPTLTHAENDNCIKLTGSDAYTWKADGSFTGTGNIDNKTHCFPPGGGGISIGAPHAPAGSAGNTRIECFFPENESDAEFYNCNLSLVDGFSAAVTCSVAGGGWPNSNNDSQPLGCGYDLLQDCPDEAYDEGWKCCKNHAGAHAESVGAVDKAFHPCQHSDEYANSAEIYYDMIGAFKFQKSDFPITCQVGEGEKAPANSKMKREVEVEVEKQKREEGHVHQHQHAGRAANHVHRLKTRDLMEVVS